MFLGWDGGGSGRVNGEAAISVKPMAMRMKMTSPDQGSDGTLKMRVTGGALNLDVRGLGVGKLAVGLWIGQDDRTKASAPAVRRTRAAST
ncbi:hypothetical protein ACGF0K_22830 [Streptomyces sp. NPDC048156]|uniref:hypothetical protein n=1 Tax=Streptomyces sp. NPDC048156 TaxID=3365502 RepID=UPI00372312A7